MEIRHGGWLRLGGIALLTVPPITTAAAAQTPPTVIEDRAQALECLTLAIAYEAGHEPPEGQQAVAEVVLNRVRDPAFPKSVCGVVFAGALQKTGCQFSFTCDGSLRHRMSEKVMAQARQTAAQVLDGGRTPLVGDALNYHADYVAPYWAPTLQRVTKIGAHIFYRRPGKIASHARAATLAIGAPPMAQAPVFAPWGLAPAPPSERR